MKRRLPLIILLLAAPALAAAARPGAGVRLQYSHSAGNPLGFAGAPAGKVQVDALALEWSDALRLDDSSQLLYGVAAAGFALDRAAGTPVPDRLREYALTVGLRRDLRPGWQLLASASPGLYGDLEADAGEAFNAPGLLLLRYERRENLTWTFGLRIDAFSDRSVVPLVGVDWEFARDWTFQVGYPRAGFARRLGPDLTLGLGASVQGGSFHISREPQPGFRPDGARLADTGLQYREIRAGLDLEYRYSSTLTVTLAAGAITDQKFDYFDRNVTIDGGSAAFVTLGLRARF